MLFLLFCDFVLFILVNPPAVFQAPPLVVPVGPAMPPVECPKCFLNNLILNTQQQTKTNTGTKGREGLALEFVGFEWGGGQGGTGTRFNYQKQ